MKNKKFNFKTASKGFAMGAADIVPGVSGGTVALILGIYDELISTISSFDQEFFKLLITFKIKKAIGRANLKFLFPLFVGIITAIISLSKVMHFLFSHYAVYTWSLFFGLILASIIFLYKTIDDNKSLKTFFSICIGSLVGYSVVSLIPVETPETYVATFFSGFIAICAMILPGISGSFILLILGKYLYVTSALKAPFSDNNFLTIITFCFGCGFGLLSFSKILNFLLLRFHSITMAVLTGFMIGSLKKIWPWREVIESKIIRGKVKVIQDAVILPNEFNLELFIAIAVMILGFSLILLLERVSNKNI